MLTTYGKYQGTHSMKLAVAIAAITPFLAADKTPEEVRKAILAADKKGKDEEMDTPAEDADFEKREAACDEREEAMDAAEEKADKDAKAEDKAAKDRKMGRDKRAKDRMDRKMGRDKRAKDAATDPEGTNDNDLEQGDPSTPAKGGKSEKGALDAAAVDARVKTAVDARVKAAVDARDALHTARREVEPIIGVCAMDTAGDVYKAALTKLGVDTKGIPDSAFPAMLKLAKDRTAAQTPTVIATDMAALEKLIPGYGRLK
jgi:uncharacterized protein